MSDEKIKVNLRLLVEKLAHQQLEQEVINNYILKYNRKATQDEIFRETFEQDENVDLEGKPCYRYRKEYAILYEELYNEFLQIVESFKE